MHDPLTQLLAHHPYLVNDGAMATELEKHGVDTNSALWSAEALINAPEQVTAVHQSYFDAGAMIATTDSYQANPQAFAKLGYADAASAQLIQASVYLAQKARTDPNQLIAGSIGPYGAYLADGSEYTGAYALSESAYQDFHRQRMQLLQAAGVDFFAMETMPNFAEIKALVHLLATEFTTMTAWVSLSVGENHDRLCDGTDFATVCAFLNAQPQVVAIGINCTAMTNVLPTLQHLAPLTAKPLVVYPNNGDTYDPSDKSWHQNPHALSFKDAVPTWQQAGARIIGGCCRTTPADIRQIAAVLQ